MIPHLDIKIKICSPLSMHRLCFVAPRHHMMIGCSWIHDHILGVRQFTHVNTKVLTWRALNVQIWPRNTDRKVKHESYERYDAHLMLAFEATPTHVMIGLGVVDLVHVITKKARGMSFLSGSSFVMWII